MVVVVVILVVSAVSLDGCVCPHTPGTHWHALVAPTPGSSTPSVSATPPVLDNTQQKLCVIEGPKKYFQKFHPSQKKNENTTFFIISKNIGFASTPPSLRLICNFPQSRRHYPNLPPLHRHRTIIQWVRPRLQSSKARLDRYHWCWVRARNIR